MENSLSSKMRSIALYLLVAIVGLNGGLHFIGLLAPIEQKMTAAQFAPYWQIVDGFMGQKMPFFGQTMLGLFLLNLILFRKAWRSLLFWIIAGVLVALVAEIVFTINEQIPMNQFMQSIDVHNLTAEQLKTVDQMRLDTLKNFGLRNWWAVIIALAMQITPFLLPKLKVYQT